MEAMSMVELERSSYGPVTLGALIDALEGRKFREDGKPRHIRYDFGNLLPSTLDSYRGFYSELALGFEDYDSRAKRLKHPCSMDEYPNVVELLTKLKAANGETFFGWKGGEFTMNSETAVFVANRGDATQCGITDLFADGDWLIVLMTDYFG
jgi:hypothetical protein